MDRKHLALILAHWILIAAPAAAGPVVCAWWNWLPWAAAAPIAAVGAMAAVVGLRLHLRGRVGLAFAVGWAVAALAMMACLTAYIDSPPAQVPARKIAAEVLALADGRPILFAGCHPSNEFGYYATVERPVRDLKKPGGELEVARKMGGAIVLLRCESQDDWLKPPEETLKRWKVPLPAGFHLRNAFRHVHEVVNEKKNIQWFAVEMVPEPTAGVPASQPATRPGP
jgi:hypothetical protein